MKPYTVEIRPAARRDLRKLEKIDALRIANAVDSLVLNPRPSGSLKMKGKEGYYRLRVNEYRIIYDILDDKLIVLVVRVRHRKEAYR